MGAHTNAVSFFFIEKNGDLVPIKNGIIGSDWGDPIVVMRDSIEMKTRYTKDKELLWERR